MVRAVYGKLKRKLSGLAESYPILKRGLSLAGSYQILWEVRRRSLGPRWQLVQPCPEHRLNAVGVQLGLRLYVIGGFSHSAFKTVSFIDVLDLTKRRWIERIPMPSNAPETHLAFTSDRQRFIYLVSGQLGPQCSPATSAAFVYDCENRVWRSLPPLPEPRYAATMQLWRGRLHVVGGMMPDRYTPAVDHWSIAVHAGEIGETQWRRDPAIPLGGGHRASAIVDDRLYVLGAQEGDFTAIDGSPIYECIHQIKEIYHAEVYSIGPEERQWRRLPDMPITSSHTESSVVVIGKSIFLFGGQVHTDSETLRLEFTDAIQEFDTVAGRWTIHGHLPYRVKTVVVAYDGIWAYAVAGQRDRSRNDASAGRIVDFAWRARFPRN